MKKGIDGVVRIPCRFDISFFKMWFLFLQPIHCLTQREMEVAAAFIKHRFDLGEKVSDENLLDKLLLGEDVKKQIKEECKMTTSHFLVVLGKLKKAGIIVDNKINSRYIPKITKKNNNYKLLLLFDFDDKQ